MECCVPYLDITMSMLNIIKSYLKTTRDNRELVLEKNYDTLDIEYFK